MATSQLRTLGNLKTQVERPINSPTLYESEAKKEASKLKQPIDYIGPLVSYYDALPEGEDKNAAREILLAINPENELDLEDVVSDLTDALTSTDSEIAQAAYNSLKLLLNQYEQVTLKTDPKDLAIIRMHYAVKNYESNLPLLEELGKEAS